MSELSTEEQERLDNWKALQLALGISPEEAAANYAPAKPPAPPTMAPPPHRAERPAAPPAPEEIHLFGEGLALDEPTVESHGDAESGQEVEVGEAPEEIPEDPASPDDQKRRRRRRRRGRRGDNENGGEAKPGEGIKSDSSTNAAPGAPMLPQDVEDTDDEELDDGAIGDDDEEEVEHISFADWTVPSWNELIGSLYRPER
jgi:hypothetical protein